MRTFVDILPVTSRPHPSTMQHILFIIGVIAAALLGSAPLRAAGAVRADSGPAMSDSIAPLSFPGSGKSIIGLYIEEIATGNVLAEYGADRPMCPASIMKAVTSASVMSLYDPDRCFSTGVRASGEISDGVLNGDIIIEASGDPTLGSSFFDAPDALRDSIIISLHAKGIDSISGTIRIDGSAIPDPSYPPGWGNDDYMWPYGAMLRGFNWRDNRYTLYLPSRRVEPYIPGLKIDFRRTKRGRMGYDSKPPLTSVKAWGRPAAKGSEVELAMPSPAEAFIHYIKSALAESGIGMGEAVIGTSEHSLHLTSVLSPDFPSILQSLMFRSDNLFAEGMLRTIAPREPRDTAVSRVKDLWQQRGADTDSVTIIDGSGLSRLNRVTPWFMADVLTWMARSSFAKEYASLFPKVGRDGTVKRLLAGTPLEGRMALKTGSMRRVRALAGYMLDPDGMPTHTVVLIVNDFPCSVSDINKAAEAFFLKFFS